MALEAVVFPHAGFTQCDSAIVDGCSGGGESWHPSSSFMQPNRSEPNAETIDTTGGTAGRRKRRRATRSKNQQVAESQRMNHIAMERHRRKQTNDYLAVIQSLLPPSYILRGDQASIVGGAINYVKQLEQLLQSLEARKRKQQRELDGLSFPFAEFFAMPRHSSSSCHLHGVPEAEVEATIVEGHVNLKVLSRNRPKLLLMLVEGLQRLCLTTLYLNLTTADGIAFYCFSLKVEDDCRCGTVEEITGEVYQMLGGSKPVVSETTVICELHAHPLF